MMNAAVFEREASKAEVLYDFWYPALLSSRVRGTRPSKTTLLGIHLLVGRTAEGRPFALRDSCPHRAMPLSFGHFDGKEIECCYHGWRFDAVTGECRAIPSIAADSKLDVCRIFADSFPCAEQDGYMWVHVSEGARSKGPIGDPPRLPTFSSSYRLTHLSAELPCSVDQGIIGLMDPAHGPFVHKSWWWRSRRSIHEKEKLFEPIPNGFRIRAHTPSSNSAPYKLLRIYGQPVSSTIEFVLPNIRLETVRCGRYWFSSRATVTPVETGRSRIDFCAAWNILNWLPLVVPAFRVLARKFLRQDQMMMAKQAIGLDHDTRMMLIDDADRPAKWYFQLKGAHLESVRRGEPMKHPMTGAVALRWRS